MKTVEKLKKLQSLQAIYENKINELLNEVKSLETNFEQYSNEVKQNGKKSDKRMTIAGILLSCGAFITSFVFPLTGGNIFAGIFAGAFLAGALVNGIVQWVKSEKCDKQIENLKPLELENYNKILKVKENIALLEQKNNKVKAEIDKLTKEENLHTLANKTQTYSTTTKTTSQNKERV